MDPSVGPGYSDPPDEVEKEPDRLQPLPRDVQSLVRSVDDEKKKLHRGESFVEPKDDRSESEVVEMGPNLDTQQTSFSPTENEVPKVDHHISLFDPSRTEESVVLRRPLPPCGPWVYMTYTQVWLVVVCPERHVRMDVL